MTKNSQSAWKWDPWLLEVDMPSTKHPTLAISLKNTDWRTWKSTGDSLFGDITQPCVDRVRWDASPGSLKRPCMVIWAWDPRDDFGKSSIKWACLVHMVPSAWLWHSQEHFPPSFPPTSSFCFGPCIRMKSPNTVTTHQHKKQWFRKRNTLQKHWTAQSKITCCHLRTFCSLYSRMPDVWETCYCWILFPSPSW